MTAPTTPTVPEDDGQSLNITPETLYGVLDEWDAAGRPDETRQAYLSMVMSCIGELRAAGQEVDLRGRCSVIDQLVHGHRSRSGNFEVKRAGHVFDAALALGLISEGREWRDARDVTTGKPVMTRLREVARLKYDWQSEDARSWLQESWPQIVTMSMVDLKRWVRDHNPDSTAWFTRPDLVDVIQRATDGYRRLYGATDKEVVDALTLTLDRIGDRWRPC